MSDVLTVLTVRLLRIVLKYCRQYPPKTFSTFMSCSTAIGSIENFVDSLGYVVSFLVHGTEYWTV